MLLVEHIDLSKTQLSEALQGLKRCKQVQYSSDTYSPGTYSDLIDVASGVVSIGKKFISCRLTWKSLGSH